MPVEDTTVATPALPLLHEPPLDPSNNAVATPRHTLVRPVIAGGSGFTVTVAIEYTLPQ